MIVTCGFSYPGLKAPYRFLVGAWCNGAGGSGVEGLGLKVRGVF